MANAGLGTETEDSRWDANRGMVEGGMNAGHGWMGERGECQLDERNSTVHSVPSQGRGLCFQPRTGLGEKGSNQITVPNRHRRREIPGTGTHLQVPIHPRGDRKARITMCDRPEFARHGRRVNLVALATPAGKLYTTCRSPRRLCPVSYTRGSAPVVLS